MRAPRTRPFWRGIWARAAHWMMRLHHSAWLMPGARKRTTISSSNQTALQKRPVPGGDPRRDLLGLLPLPGSVGWVERLRDPTRWSAIVVVSREELDPTYECCASTSLEHDLE